jgi:indole-3-glycerol phosphate synthase
MPAPEFDEALTAIYDCSPIILANASYILAELPNERLPEPLRQYLAGQCEALLSTRHDLMTELAEIEDLRDADVILARMKRAIAWLEEDLSALHLDITELQEFSNKNPETAPAYILVAESATNILNAFQRAKTAVDSISIE